jgi:hypothetical protein
MHIPEGGGYQRILSFIQGEMKARIIKKVIYSDTLFRFREKKV